MSGLGRSRRDRIQRSLFLDERTVAVSDRGGGECRESSAACDRLLWCFIVDE